MTDTEMIDCVEKNGIQIWPTRKSKHGPVLQWWVQNILPFCQTARPRLRDALEALAQEIKDHQL